MPHITPEMLGWFSLVVATLAEIRYFHTIFQGKTKPHAFSWLVWAIAAATVFFSQDVSGAGPGAWATGLTAVVSFVVFTFALIKGENLITRLDWLSLLGALVAILLWYVTKDPLWAVALLSIIDALGFYPTFRKSWNKPEEESALAYGLAACKYVVALLALENVNLTTVLFPASVVLTNSTFVAMVLWRKKSLAKG